jgi:nucleoside-diphosphate-sugar epimerase
MSPLHAWCTAAVRGQQIGTTAPARLRDYAYVDDVAEAIVRLAGRRTAEGAVYNISSGRPISEQETLDLVSSVIPVERSDALPATQAVSSARPPLDVRRLAADADFACTPDLRAAIANYVQWLQAERDG